MEDWSLGTKLWVITVHLITYPFHWVGAKLKGSKSVYDYRNGR